MRQTELQRSYSLILSKISFFTLPLILPSSNKSCKIFSSADKIKLKINCFMILSFCQFKYMTFCHTKNKNVTKIKFFFFLTFFLKIKNWFAKQTPSVKNRFIIIICTYFFYMQGRSMGAPLYADSRRSGPLQIKKYVQTFKSGFFTPMS